MKKIFLSVVVMLTTSLMAQVGINNMNPDESAVLDIKSNNKGVLFPRMEQTERDQIKNPATGLIIYNNTNGRLQINIGTESDPIWKNFALETPLTGGLVADLVCNTQVEGKYKKGVLLNDTNDVTVEVKVTKLSPNASENEYSISTNTVNGYSFSASGTFTQTGVQTIRLQGSGTPSNKGTDNFILTYNGQTCDFPVTVVKADPVSKIIGDPMYGSSIASGSPAYYSESTNWGNGGGGKSWSAMVYNKDLIGTSGTINSISFLINSGTACQSTVSNQKIYMKQVDYNVFENSNNEDASQMTEVFSGEVTWVKVGSGTAPKDGWTTITLNTPFQYDNSKSLLIYYVNEYGKEDRSCLNTWGAAGPSFVVDSNGNSSNQKVSKYAKYSDAPKAIGMSSHQNPVIKIDFN